MKDGAAILIRASWILSRAGYVSSTRQRGDRTLISWKLSTGTADIGPDVATEAEHQLPHVDPMPCRQDIESSFPEAVMSLTELEDGYTTYMETLRLCAGGEDGAMMPVIMVSHCWQTVDHPDPNGDTLKYVAKALARDMPHYQSWGVHDVGVFLDWSSLYQQTAHVGRTDDQFELFRRAKNQMCVYYAHKLTTVYLVPYEVHQEADALLKSPPSRSERGWPFFEAAACTLFKSKPPPSPYRHPNGTLLSVLPKVVDLAVRPEDIVEVKQQPPPMSAPRFNFLLASKIFTHEDTDVLFVSRLYRKVIEDGYNGQTRFGYARLNWGDDELSELGATLKEVSCSHVLSLDLSYNDLGAVGLEALGGAIAMGALSSLQVLNLSYCTRIHALPESFCELRELQALDLEGCVGLKSLPEGITRLAALKEINIHNCHGLDADALGALPASAVVIRDRRPFTSP